jgi:hypothetical protein
VRGDAGVDDGDDHVRDRGADLGAREIGAHHLVAPLADGPGRRPHLHGDVGSLH